MPNVYLISDCHFGHDNILKPEYDNRPFATIEEMDEHIIQEWNKACGDDDIMLDLGDTFFRGTRLIDDIFPRLNGQIIEIKGNHTYNKQIKYITERYSNYACFPHLDFEYNGFHFWCAHKPDDPWYDSVNWYDLTNVRLSGHWHSSSPKGAQFDWRGTPWNDKHRHQGTTETNEVFLPGLSYNVSLDVIDYKPISLDKICEDIVEKKKELAEQDTF